MPKIRSTSHVILAALSALSFAIGMPTNASAEKTIFDWGGSTKEEKGSGKKTVKFSAAAKVGDIIVSFTDRRLYYVTKPGEAVSYPVATPREQDRWQGEIRVSSKREKPAWTPTPSMRAENPRLPSWVPGGHPMNPLGTYALYLGDSLYRIHGTDAPWTIGTAVSKGCVRMYNQDAADLYARVKVGTKVLVTWAKYATPDGEPIAVADPPAKGSVTAAAAPAKSEPAKGETVKTDAAKPDTTKADVAKPDPAPTKAAAPAPTAGPKVTTGSIAGTTDPEAATPPRPRKAAKPAPSAKSVKPAPKVPLKNIDAIEVTSI